MTNSEDADSKNRFADMKSRITDEGVPLDAVSDAEDNPNVLGFGMMATTGEVLVPREWLESKWDEYNLPESLLPSATWASSAYKRAMFHLLDSGADNRTVSTDAGPQRVSLDVKKGSGNERHVLANIWFDDDHPSADELDIEEGGEWRQTTLGLTNYDADAQDMVSTQRIDEAHPLAAVWEDLESRARELFETHKVSHNGDDMRDVLYDFTRYESDSIPLRDGGAVYFVPAQDLDTIEALRSIWEEMNAEFKAHGRKTEIQTIPVISDTDRKELIESRASKVVRDEIDRVLEDAFDDLEDPDDDTPEDEIVSEIEDALGDHANTAEVYNALVDARINVRDVLEDFASEVADEAREDLVQETISRLEDGEAVTDGGTNGQARAENGKFI